VRGALLFASLIALSACELDDAGDLFGATAGSAGNAGGVSCAGSAGASGVGGDAWPDADAATPDASAGNAAGASGGAFDAAVSEDGCLPHTFCVDVDQDGYGEPGSRTVACEPPGADWLAEISATTCTDCFDQSADVHPGSTICAIDGYVAGGAPPSFDTNCDGVETECGAKAGQCGGIGVCSGAGYMPAGGGQNPYCGSKSYQNCSGLDCKASTQSLPNEPLGCR
jgi:hypothetical protein